MVGVQTYLQYDPLLRLYQTNSDSIPIARFAYDGLNALAEYDSSGTLQRRWVYDPTTGQPVVWYEGTAVTAAARRYLSADERGSVISVSDSTGASLGINTYDEYGIPAATNIGRYGYTGQAWLEPAALWYLNARMYSPAVGGTFLQPDPIGYGGGMNIYNYVGGDPVNFVDPLGLKRLVCRDYPWTYTNPWFPESNTTYYDRECQWVYEASDFNWGPRRDPTLPIGGPFVTYPLPPPPPQTARPAYCNSWGYGIGEVLDQTGSGAMTVGGVAMVAGAAQAAISPLTGGTTAVSGGLTFAGGLKMVQVGALLQFSGKTLKYLASGRSMYSSADVMIGMLKTTPAFVAGAPGALADAAAAATVPEIPGNPCD